MTRKDFENVLKIGEHVGVEFKRGGNGAQNDTFEMICAFLNRFGRADELGSGVRNPFHYTKQYSGVTIPQLQEYLGMSRNGVKKGQERLKTSGVIRCVGSDKGGYWEIIGVD